MQVDNSAVTLLLTLFKNKLLLSATVVAIPSSTTLPFSGRTGTPFYPSLLLVSVSVYFKEHLKLVTITCVYA